MERSQLTAIVEALNVLKDTKNLLSDMRLKDKIISGDR